MLGVIEKKEEKEREEDRVGEGGVTEQGSRDGNPSFVFA